VNLPRKRKALPLFCAIFPHFYGDREAKQTNMFDIAVATRLPFLLRRLYSLYDNETEEVKPYSLRGLDRPATLLQRCTRSTTYKVRLPRRSPQ
jgi:hypothetical protein